MFLEKPFQNEEDQGEGEIKGRKVANLRRVGSTLSGIGSHMPNIQCNPVGGRDRPCLRFGIPRLDRSQRSFHNLYMSLGSQQDTYQSKITNLKCQITNLR